MRYILNKNTALRSWRRVPYAYYVRHERNAYGLKKEEYELLSLCDGQHELENSELLESLVCRGMCSPCSAGESLDSWQIPKVCDNRYFPAMNWMLTGRCNFNCRHCFNAADNSRIQSEFTLEEARKLIREARDCGINAFTITGGEPMIHPYFTEIVREIYENGMYVEELNTNGSFLTHEILDEMASMDCRPLMKISFDGVGHHDWLRNRMGAETDALRAIRLCVENGFSVKVQTNVHRLNKETMLPTAELLDKMGVSEMRIIRTTEAPRWVQNAGDACLTLEEYFELMLDFTEKYIRRDCRMDIDIWQFLTLHPTGKMYRPRPRECAPGKYRDNMPVCRGNRGMVAVAANGNLYPCHQMSGYYEAHHDFLGNVKTDGLQKCLQESRYLNEVCTTLADLKSVNQECASCHWFKICCGGCRAIALAMTHNKMASDPSKCLYFKGGYDERIQNLLADWTMWY